MDDPADIDAVAVKDERGHALLFDLWAKVAYEAQRDCAPGEPRRGHALVLVGENGSGKSFLQHYLITPLLGGREADPRMFLMGNDAYNSDVLGAEHLRAADCGDEDVGLPASAAGSYPHEFSGGQRQRIAIARALITNPKLVVADEAVSALDLSIQAQILRLILSLRDRHGLTVLFITHNIGVVDEIADRVGVMQAGRLVEAGPVREVLDHPQQEYTRRLLAAEPTLAVLGRRRKRA